MFYNHISVKNKDSKLKKKKLYLKSNMHFEISRFKGLFTRAEEQVLLLGIALGYKTSLVCL